MKRAELQSHIQSAIYRVMQDLGIPNDAAHQDRLIRVLLRTAAEWEIGKGRSGREFRTRAVDIYTTVTNENLSAVRVPDEKPVFVCNRIIGEA
jgi:hypothetical protein